MLGTQPERIGRVLAPLREFTRSTVAGGVLLMAAAVVALIWSNSPWAESYTELWLTPVTIGFGELVLSMDLHHWINDGLMAIFFLLVGLEIKRELLVGELASVRRALLPAAAAVGGAIVPAVIFLAIVGGSGVAARGWGVPMATDIAFALGVLALLGRRVPLGLRIFVTALAIVDDLVAVLIIAVFYSGDLSLIALAVAAGLVAMLIGANWLGIRQPVVYALLGLALWLAVLQSGVHATVAGVLLAMTIPARQRIESGGYVERAQSLINEYGRAVGRGIERRHSALWELEGLTEKAQAPMLRMEHNIAPWVSFLIVPLFALANAGVTISADIGRLVAEPIVLGVAAGLIIGKQIGITGAAWLIVRSGFASLPPGVSWRQIYGAAWVCGIGFTMSLFIALLAYGDSESLDLAKVGILGASIIAGVGGFLLLRTRLVNGPRPAPTAPREPDPGA